MYLVCVVRFCRAGGLTWVLRRDAQYIQFSFRMREERLYRYMAVLFALGGLMVCGLFATILAEPWPMVSWFLESQLIGIAVAILLIRGIVSSTPPRFNWKHPLPSSQKDKRPKQPASIFTEFQSIKFNRTAVFQSNKEFAKKLGEALLPSHRGKHQKLEGLLEEGKVNISVLSAAAQQAREILMSAPPPLKKS